MALTFDPTAHVYRFEGRVLPSVTQVLRRAGHLDDLAWYGTKESRERGVLVHEAARRLDQGGTWLPAKLVITAGGEGWPVPVQWGGYVDAYVAFLRQYRGLVTWTRVEEAMARPDLRVAGRPDRVGVFVGRPAILEIKTSDPAVWHGYQTAGYDYLDPLPVPRLRLGVYLSRAGSFRVRVYGRREDQARFLDALRQGGVYG